MVPGRLEYKRIVATYLPVSIPIIEISHPFGSISDKVINPVGADPFWIAAHRFKGGQIFRRGSIY
jgi:hypothetical protein